MDFLLLIGRIIYGGFFLMSGINHFKNTEGLTSYAESKHVPMPRTGVYVTGAMLLLGGLGIMTGMMIRWAVLLIVAFLAMTSYKMHDFWNTKDPQSKMMEQTQFMKNLALLGAALMMISILEPWAYSL